MSNSQIFDTTFFCEVTIVDAVLTTSDLRLIFADQKQ